VAGVGQQREGAGDERADDLDDEDRRGDRQDDRERPSVPVARGQRVVVTMTAAVAVLAAHAVAACSSP
jgi:hypothetical protein